MFGSADGRREKCNAVAVVALIDSPLLRCRSLADAAFCNSPRACAVTGPLNIRGIRAVSIPWPMTNERMELTDRFRRPGQDLRQAMRVRYDQKLRERASV
jgi:hypothetical protein